MLVVLVCLVSASLQVHAQSLEHNQYSYLSSYLPPHDVWSSELQDVSWNEPELVRFKRATSLVAVTSASTYPFVLAVSTPTTQGMGVIINTNWAMTVQPLVAAYTGTPGNIKFKSGSLDVVNGGTIHRTYQIVVNSNLNLATQTNMLVLCKVCPVLPNNVVTIPNVNWAASTPVIPIRWYNDRTVLKSQTATLADKNNVCRNIAGFSTSLQVCSENLGMLNAYDYGAVLVDATKRLVGLAVHISNAVGTVNEIFDDASSYRNWISSNAV